MVRDWRWWLMVAACYLAFTVDGVVERYGYYAGLWLLFVLVGFCYWSIINVAAELDAKQFNDRER